MDLVLALSGRLDGLNTGLPFFYGRTGLLSFFTTFGLVVTFYADSPLVKGFLWGWTLSSLGLVSGLRISLTPGLTRGLEPYFECLDSSSLCFDDCFTIFVFVDIGIGSDDLLWMVVFELAFFNPTDYFELLDLTSYFRLVLLKDLILLEDYPGTGGFPIFLPSGLPICLLF